MHICQLGEKREVWRRVRGRGEEEEEAAERERELEGETGGGGRRSEWIRGGREAEGDGQRAATEVNGWQSDEGTSGRVVDEW